MQAGNSLCQACGAKGSEVFCQCAKPEITLCIACVGEHIQKSPGMEHATRPIGELPYYKIPGYFDRLATRKATFPRVKEQAWSSVNTVDKALAEYKQTVERTLAEYTTKVDKEVLEMQQLIVELTTTAKNNVRNLTTQSQKQIAELNAMKAELAVQIHGALEEVERTLKENEPQLTSKYGTIFRQFTETFQDFHLFSFNIQVSQLDSSTNFTQFFPQIEAYFRRYGYGQMPQGNAALPQAFDIYSATIKNSSLPTITLTTELIFTRFLLLTDPYAAILGGTLELYDRKSLEVISFGISKNIRNAISLDRYTLLCLVDESPNPVISSASGSMMNISNQPFKRVHNLHLPSLQFTELPSFLEDRAGPGLAKTGDFVYAFGGFGISVQNPSLHCLKSCEKYGLQSRQWRALGDMTYPRNNFTPCTYSAVIYLVCTSFVNTLLETFNPQSEKFTVLNISLPIQELAVGSYRGIPGQPGTPLQSLVSGNSVAFVANGELCLLTANKQMARWKIDSETQFRMTTVDRGCWSIQPPLVMDSLVLLPNALVGKVEKFSLQTYSFA